MSLSEFSNTRLGNVMFWLGRTFEAGLMSWLIWVARNHPSIKAHVPDWYDPELSLLLFQWAYGALGVMSAVFAIVGVLLTLLTLAIAPRELLKPAGSAE